MSKINKHGLSRWIPGNVKREVRKNSGFGCVICGLAICEYEHVTPEWNDAKVHDPNCMTLLCGSCHSKKTRGIYSVEKIKNAMKTPKCREDGFNRDYLDFGKNKPIIQLGKTTFYHPESLITVNGMSILSILPPVTTDTDEPFGLFAYFSDNEGEGILGIENNIWKGNSHYWDIETKGRKLLIRKKLGDIVLDIENIPNDRFIIHHIKMRYQGYDIIGNDQGVKILTPSNEEIFTLCGGGEIYGKIVLDIRDNQLFLTNLILNNAELNWAGGGVAYGCMHLGGSFNF